MQPTLTTSFLFILVKMIV